jgi:hypothetical protein
MEKQSKAISYKGIEKSIGIYKVLLYAIPKGEQKELIQQERKAKQTIFLLPYMFLAN